MRDLAWKVLNTPSGKVRTNHQYCSISTKPDCTPEKIKAESEPQVPRVQNYYSFYNRETINTVERTWLVRKPALKTIYVQPANLGRILLKFSPVGLYDTATEAWAGTDLEGIQDFFSTVQRHRRAVVDYFYDKKIFESRQWFAADKGTADWDALPQFSFQRSDTGIKCKTSTPGHASVAYNECYSLYSDSANFYQK